MSKTAIAKEYWVSKNDVKLYVYRKYQGSPAGKPVLILVHGSSLSALPGYDLQVPGRGTEYSMMDQCAERGFDVWTLDHEGYGRSTRTTKTSNISEGADDLAAAIPIIEAETKQSRFHVYGQSSGSLRAAVFAQRHPERVARLVLDAFVWTGEGSPTLIKRREGLDQWRASHVRKIDRAGLLAIFTRDKPGTSEPEVAEAVATAQLSYGDCVPTGTFIDMCAHLPVVDPTKIQSPVLIMRGEHDGIATIEDLLEFFKRLPNNDKAIAILSDCGHIAHFSLNRRRFYQWLFAFLEMPQRIKVGAA